MPHHTAEVSLNNVSKYRLSQQQQLLAIAQSKRQELNYNMAAVNSSWNHTVSIPGSSYNVIYDKLSKLTSCSEINRKISLVEIVEGKKNVTTVL